MTDEIRRSQSRKKAYIYITYLHQILGRLIFHFNGTRLYLPSSSTPYGVARYIGVQEQHLITTLTLCLLIRIKGTYIRQVSLLPFRQTYQQSLPLPLCCRTSLTNNRKSLFLPCFTDFYLFSPSPRPLQPNPPFPPVGGGVWGRKGEVEYLLANMFTIARRYKRTRLLRSSTR